MNSGDAKFPDTLSIWAPFFPFFLLHCLAEVTTSACVLWRRYDSYDFCRGLPTHALASRTLYKELQKVDFTREPIIETVITPKEGYKLVVRSSKASGQEEFFVDAVEVVSFGNALFFRSVEKPKSFLVPTSDYEVLEVREARMVLKHVGVERSIKIGGGKESSRPSRETNIERQEPVPTAPIAVTPATSEAPLATPADAPVAEDRADGSRFDRKRDRRRHYRRRRGGREEGGKEGWNEQEEGSEGDEAGEESEKISLVPPNDAESEATLPHTAGAVSTSLLSSLLPPPPTLISETIAKYRESDKFKDAFYSRENKEEASSSEEGQNREEEGEKEDKPSSSEDFSYESPLSESAQIETIDIFESEELKQDELKFQEGEEEQAEASKDLEEPIVHTVENNKHTDEEDQEPIS